jgi:hypothetical protein
MHAQFGISCADAAWLMGAGASWRALVREHVLRRSASVLVIGLDFSDNQTFDPARFATNSAPMVLCGVRRPLDDGAWKIRGPDSGAGDAMGAHAR